MTDSMERGTPKKYPRSKTIASRVALAFLLVIVCLITVRLVGNYIDSLRKSKSHTFDAESDSNYLNQTEALALAQETLRAEGYDIADWRPYDEGHNTMSPDGLSDSFLTRSVDPNCGRISFLNTAGKEGQSLNVELHKSGDHIRTYVWVPK